MAEPRPSRSPWVWVAPLALLLGLGLCTAVAVRACVKTAVQGVAAPINWAQRLVETCTEAKVREEVRFISTGALPQVRFQFLEETIAYRAVREYDNILGDCTVEVDVPVEVTWFVDLEDPVFRISADPAHKVVKVVIPPPRWNKPAIDPKDLLAGSRATKSDWFTSEQGQIEELQRGILGNLALYLDGRPTVQVEEGARTRGPGNGAGHLREVQAKAREQMARLVRDMCVRRWQGDKFPEDWRVEVQEAK